MCASARYSERRLRSVAFPASSRHSAANALYASERLSMTSNAPDLYGGISNIPAKSFRSLGKRRRQIGVLVNILRPRGLSRVTGYGATGTARFGTSASGQHLPPNTPRLRQITLGARAARDHSMPFR